MAPLEPPRLCEEKPIVFCVNVFPFIFFLPFLLSNADCSVFVQLTTGSNLAFNYSFSLLFNSNSIQNLFRLQTSGWFHTLLCPLCDTLYLLLRDSCNYLLKSIRGFRRFPNDKMNNTLCHMLPVGI